MELEGVIKYKTDKHDQDLDHGALDIVKIESWREILFSIGLIGEYPDGVGYGNLSGRFKNGLLITASQTGGQERLKTYGYSFVSQYSLETFSLTMHGPMKASSETLTHAAIYESNPNINYVFHVHHKKMWNQLKNGKADRISKDITYGTAEMAQAMEKITASKNDGLVVMEGHEDGILTFGDTPYSAGKHLLKAFSELL